MRTLSLFRSKESIMYTSSLHNNIFIKKKIILSLFLNYILYQKVWFDLPLFFFIFFIKLQPVVKMVIETILDTLAMICVQKIFRYIAMD